MELVVDDTYVDEEVKNYLKNQCDDIGRVLRYYIRTMNEVLDGGFMEGATATALKEFLEQVESDTGKNNAGSDEMEDDASRLCTNFIKKVDEADKDLY